MTDSRVLLDTSAWMEFLAGTQQMKDIVDQNNPLFASVLSVFEIKRKLARLELSLAKMRGIMDYIKSRSMVIDLTSAISEDAAELKLHAVDALIYASAKHKQAVLITYDYDFKHMDNVSLLTR